ncbi:hypothetical protein PR202_gb04204 [Eleusine coracana subsp. coracana]|uniref:Uncharacterized protein n=1 Tax=Eleusine coracana subsp. coracana TaxID=191504 RepID=A0AAV5E415_ELECO|nr:hypothetical protein PR202_gb04204 [Eleusine coracana subsp. coracana]
MAEECPRGGAEELWLPDEFLDDDFFSQEEKAAVAAKSESDEEDGLGGLSRRLSGLVSGDRDGDDVPAPGKDDVMAGSPQSTLCGLPASGEESPNGVASQVSSPPSSPLEQPPADPWDLLYEAAGQVARLRTNAIPVPAKNAAAAAHQARAVAPAARKPVLLPARVVQALNLNVEDLGARPAYPGGYVLDHDALVSRSNALLANQHRSAVIASEANLPAEWTY